MRAPLLLPLVLAAACASPNSRPASPALAGVARQPNATADAPGIARIESSLRPAVRVRGREYAPATIEQRMDQLGVPAVSIAVVRNGRVAWARAYGVADADSRTPATTETLFQAASISKPVAAMGALLLVQEGRLSLDEDVNRRLRRWQVPSHQWAAEAPVTLRHLLSHTAGLTVHGFPGYPANARVPSTVEVLTGGSPANTQAVVVNQRPGQAWRYSGGGTTVAQLMMEDVSGVPFAQFMKERVLDPVGMTSSTYEQPLPTAMHHRAATGHRVRARPIAGRFHTYPEMAAAGLWTTPTDLARWILAVQRALGGDTTGVLRPEMARAMITPQGGPHGLGPQLEGAGDSLRFAHGGANEGFRGVFMGFASRGEGVVIMTNGDAGGTLGSELMLAIATEYGWPGLRPREIVPIAMSPEAMREYEGRFGTRAQPVQITVSVEGSSLYLITPDGVRRETVPVAADRFQDTAGANVASFDRDENGRVSALRVQGLTLPRQ